MLLSSTELIPDLYRQVENKNSMVLEIIFFKLDLRGYKETRSIFQACELKIGSPSQSLHLNSYLGGKFCVKFMQHTERWLLYYKYKCTCTFYRQSFKQLAFKKKYPLIILFEVFYKYCLKRNENVFCRKFLASISELF